MLCATQVCGAVLLGVGIALIIDDDAIQWISDITDGAGMNDGLFQASVYLMTTIGNVSAFRSIFSTLVNQRDAIFFCFNESLDCVILAII